MQSMQVQACLHTCMGCIFYSATALMSSCGGETEAGANGKHREVMEPTAEACKGLHRVFLFLALAY